MDVAALIEQAIRKDGLNALTVYPCEDGWQASARFTGGSGWRVCAAPTASEAIIELLSGPAPANDDGGVFG